MVVALLVAIEVLASSVLEVLIVGDVVVLVVEPKCIVRLAVSAVNLVKFLLDQLVKDRFFVAIALKNKVPEPAVIAVVLVVKDVNDPKDQRDLNDLNAHVLKTNKCFLLPVINVVPIVRFLLNQLQVNQFSVMLVSVQNLVTRKKIPAS